MLHMMALKTETGSESKHPRPEVMGQTIDKIA